jgi:hypothetical protein
MRSVDLLLTSLAAVMVFGSACAPASDHGPTGSYVAGVSGGTTAGVTAATGGNPGRASAGTLAPPQQAGSGAGASSGVGMSAGRSGRGNAGRGGAAGTRAAGSGGSTQAAGSSATAGNSGTTAGTGGPSSGCTQNLTCKLTAPAGTGEPHQDCVARINQFRTQCACLPELARWTEGEACADMMAEYDSAMGRSAHAGFMARICTGGNAQNECPGWGNNDQVVSGCLQQMWDEGPPPMADCSGDCFQKYGHFINMTNTKLNKVACGFFTASTNKVWSVQNFSP